ncbi:hypothetical protein EDC30_10330 [Paucimonas lemoignei]|uniref:ATP-grasp domain-containing protein n=1 Tax=Paucimonas lemoignei TaxID=29443 RepID=A0A4R3HX54_PAULE|nr:hypothetical protein [Paucimonas lemoignei]TCS37738.1 hypothetical protein EDC30_10330 [Paucimonas lemoignei]
MYKIVLMNHFKCMSQAVKAQDATCTLDMDNFHLTIAREGQRATFEPQFFVRNERGLVFTPEFGDDVINFVGWLPYFNKRWPLGYDKLEFKKWAVKNGHRTPPYWQIVDAPIRDVLRKKSKSSIGRGISGPYKVIEPGSQEALLSEGDYFESFTFGRICKVWYWNGKVVAAEVRKAPTVEGDGIRNIKQLVSDRTDPFGREINWHAVQSTLHYQGFSPAYIPQLGEKIVVDYQYASRLTNLTFNNDNLVLAGLAPQYAEQMARMGEDLWTQLPQEIRQNTLFSVDGMVDDDDQIWWVEANCNPLVHPDAYPHMVASVLEGGAATKTPAEPPAAPPPFQPPPPFTLQ